MPSQWLRLDETKELITLLEDKQANVQNCTMSNGVVSPVLYTRKGGNGSNGKPGTFAVKQLVYAYAMWISAEFHLEVIDAYDAMVTGTVSPRSIDETVKRGTLACIVALVREMDDKRCNLESANGVFRGNQ